MELSIIIVTWNTKEFLNKCLDSIYKNRGNLELEILVVDNASADGTIDMLKKYWPKIKLIANKINLGFAAANNQAIKQATGRYILLLNPDTEIKNDALTKAIHFFRQHEQIGVLGVKLLNSDGSLQPSVRHFPTIFAIVLILSKIAKLLPNLPALKKYLATDFDYSYAQRVDQVMGAFFLTSRDVINQIGSLDERFFIWFEEVDFCRRVYQAGFAVWFYPEAAITHYGGQSFKQALTIKKQWFFFQSALKYFTKHIFTW